MKVLKALRGIFVIVGLSILVLGINISQMLSLVLLLVSRKQFTKFNMGCKALFCWGNWVASKACGNEFIITGDIPCREDAIIMCNHQVMSDIPVVWVWGYPSGMNGNMKWFVKDSLKYVPGPGWGLKFLGALFVKRNWSQDAETIRKTFKILMEWDFPFWVVIFPEGTRLTPEKLAASQAYAKRKGLPLYERVLMPRPKGAWSSVSGLRPKLQAIYDVSIGYEAPEAPQLRKYFGIGGYRIHVRAVRVPIADIPMMERDFNQWMMQRFVLKDEWLKTIPGRV